MMLVLLVQDHGGFADITCFSARSPSRLLHQSTLQGLAFKRAQTPPDSLTWGRRGAAKAAITQKHYVHHPPTYTQPFCHKLPWISKYVTKSEPLNS